MTYAFSDTERVEAIRLKEELARRQARTSLRAYGRLVFEVDAAPHHRLIEEALEAIEQGKIRRLLVIAPPGHAKSTVGSIIFPSWYIGKHPAANIIGITTTDTLGGLYSDAVANVIEHSDDWRGVFPGVVPDTKRGWSKDGRFVRVQGVKRDPKSKDPTIMFIGAGGGVIGRRGSGVIIDDPIDEATARSDTLLEQRRTWIQRSVISRLQPEAWAVCMGTLWAQDDVVDTLRQTGDWTTIWMQARSTSLDVSATISIPDGVSWTPSRYEEMNSEPDWW